MARSRVIKPEFWSDEKLATLSRDTRLTFIGMWGTCDDFGVSKAHPAWLKSQIYPYDEIKLSAFQQWLKDLERLKRIIPFNSNGEQFYYVPGFVKHQKVDHPSQTNRNPAPPLDILSLANDSRDSREDEHQTPLQTETETEVKQKLKHLDSVLLSEEEYNNLLSALGKTSLDSGIEQLDYSITVKGGKYKDHYKTLLNWHKRGFIKATGSARPPDYFSNGSV